MNINIREAQQTPRKMNSEKPTPRHINHQTFKRQRQKENLESSKREVNPHKEFQ